MNREVLVRCLAMAIFVMAVFIFMNRFGHHSELSIEIPPMPNTLETDRAFDKPLESTPLEQLSTFDVDLLRQNLTPDHFPAQAEAWVIDFGMVSIDTANSLHEYQEVIAFLDQKNYPYFFKQGKVKKNYHFYVGPDLDHSRISKIFQSLSELGYRDIDIEAFSID